MSETSGGASPARLMGRPAVQFALCLAFALAVRISAFGDPAIHIDEGFYLLVGEMMRHGAVPYVDIWDRKPLGLFLLYHGFAAMRLGPLGYQLAAWLAVSGTAFLIARIAGPLSGRAGAILAALVYIASLDALQGIGGQAPVFYNLFICGAYALVFRSIPDLRRGSIPLAVHAAMALAGVAITIKHTTAFEGALLGLFVVWTLAQAGVPPRRLLPATGLLLLPGILPGAAIAAWYWQAGYWGEFYQAMVLSNLAKAPAPPLKVLSLLGRMLLALAPLLLLACLAIRLDRRCGGASRLPPLLAGWIIAAVIGVVSVPNFYLHYALPLTVPLAIVSASLLDRPRWGGRAALAAIAIFCIDGKAFDFKTHRQNREAMQDIALAMHHHSANGSALVFSAPPYLYALSGLRPLSPLFFPNHLNELTELDVSHFRTMPELKAILARRPGVIVMKTLQRTQTYNPAAWALVQDYAATHCRPIPLHRTNGVINRKQIHVFGDCR